MDRTAAVPAALSEAPAVREALLRGAHEASLAIAASLDRERVLNEIVARCAALFEGATATVYLRKSGGEVLERVADNRAAAGPVLARGDGPASRAAEGGRTVADDEPAGDGGGNRTLIAVPLIYSGEVLGVLEVGFQPAGSAPPHAVELLEWIAPHAAMAVAHARLFERSHEMLTLMQAINDRSAAVSSIAQAILDARFDLHRMLADSLQRTLSLLSLKAGSILLSHPVSGGLHVVVHFRFPQDEAVLAPQQMISRDPVGLAARSALERQPIVVLDVERDERTKPAREQLRRFGIGALAVFPLLFEEDVVGVMLVGSENSRSLDAGALDTLRVIAGALAQGAANARLYGRVRADQEQFKAVISSSGEVVLSLDRLGRVTLANEAAHRAFGFDPDATVGRPLSEVTPNVTLNRAVERAVRSEQRERVGFEVVLANDSVLFCNLSPIGDEAGQLLGWVAVMQDISRFKETERMKSDMILTASHDLRNPVNLTLGALDMLNQNSANFTPTQREVLDLATLGGRRIEALITDLLDLERVERRVGLALQECNLVDIAHTVVTENRMSAQSRHQLLEATLPDDLPAVWGDPKRLYQVVANLVSNAIKYTPASGRISVGLRQEHAQVLLEVADTGRGIPQDAQARIFERFYRVSGSAAIDPSGTGLGLALVRSIVEQHSGRVWVTSQAGHGSTFFVSLPAYHPPGDAEPARAGEPTA